MADPAKVLSEALDLPVRERLRIAGALMRSVDPEEDEDAAEAWVAELARRSATVADGTAKLHDAESVHERVRQLLRARRDARR
jgi:putative addiction module component (TIGR02574 family)